MSADEPILFEETIWCDNAKIILIGKSSLKIDYRELQQAFVEIILGLN